MSEATRQVLEAGGESLMERLKTNLIAGREAIARGEHGRSFDEQGSAGQNPNARPPKKA